MVPIPLSSAAPGKLVLPLRTHHPSRCTPPATPLGGLQDACICDAAKLTSAQSAFNDTYDQLPGALSGAWVMWLAGVLLLINFGCQVRVHCGTAGVLLLGLRGWRRFGRGALGRKAISSRIEAWC